MSEGAGRAPEGWRRWLPSKTFLVVCALVGMGGYSLSGTWRVITTGLTHARTPQTVGNSLSSEDALDVVAFVVGSPDRLTAERATRARDFLLGEARASLGAAVDAFPRGGADAIVRFENDDEELVGGWLRVQYVRGAAKLVVRRGVARAPPRGLWARARARFYLYDYRQHARERDALSFPLTSAARPWSDGARGPALWLHVWTRAAGMWTSQVRSLTALQQPKHLERPIRSLWKDLTGAKQYAKLAEELGGPPLECRTWWECYREVPIKRSELLSRVGPVRAVPRAVSIGPVVEVRRLDLLQLSTLPLVSGAVRLVERKGAEGARTPRAYRLPTAVNTALSPKDEHQALVAWPLGTAPEEVTLLWRPSAFETWVYGLLTAGSLEALRRRLPGSEYDVESVRVLLLGSPYWLVLGVLLVSVLHFIFEVAATGAEVRFWRTRPTGMSASSLRLDIVFDLVILAYLRDVGTSTATVVLVLAKTALSIWKLSRLTGWHIGKMLGAGAAKGSKVAKTSTEKASKAGTLTNAQAEEKENVVVGRLLRALVPVVLSLGAYNWVAGEYAGPLQWAVRTAALFAYAGGAVAMLPQVLRNYYLQSVEHLPWTVLSYQFVNTFIDDLFSCFIRMPDMHKASVFRDDVIFLVYIYQMWIYRKSAKQKTKKD